MKKRILSMILALLMLASAVSCGKEENADNVENSTEINSDTEENTVPEETEPTYTPAVRDMDGFTLSIIHQVRLICHGLN